MTPFLYGDNDNPAVEKTRTSFSIEGEKKYPGNAKAHGISPRATIFFAVYFFTACCFSPLAPPKKAKKYKKRWEREGRGGGKKRKTRRRPSPPVLVPRPEA